MVIGILFIQIFSSMADQFSMYHFHLRIAASIIWMYGFTQSHTVNTMLNHTIIIRQKYTQSTHPGVGFTKSRKCEIDRKS